MTSEFFLPLKRGPLWVPQFPDQIPRPTLSTLDSLVLQNKDDIKHSDCLGEGGRDSGRERCLFALAAPQRTPPSHMRAALGNSAGLVIYLNQ